MNKAARGRWHARVLASCAAVICVVLTMLVGARPVSAQPQGAATLTVSLTALSATRVTAARPVSVGPALTASCPVGINHYDRTHLCWLQPLLVIFLRNKKPIGSTAITLFQYMTLRGTSLVWSEVDVVVGLKSTKTTAPIDVTSLNVSCGGSPCAAVGDFPAGRLKIGSSGSVTYGSRLSVGESEEDIVNTYLLDYTALPFEKDGDTPWKAPLSYRCDNGVAQTGSAGCVIPAATPILALSIKQAGASAALFKWAQDNMNAHWGLRGKGSPLTRASGGAGVDNRDVVCDGTFKRQGTVVVKGGKNDVDSCDEFPYAATVQSGAAALKKEKKTGAACAQLQSVRTASKGSEAAQWGNVKVIGTPNHAAPCVRGHVPNRLNGSTGGSYSVFVRENQLFVGENFWVSVGP